MSLTTNIVAYWKYDSSNSNDSVGSNNGTDTSITYSTGNGKINIGAGFTAASSSKIVIPQSASFNAASYSISLWFKRTGNQSTTQILFAKDAPPAGWALYLTSGNVLALTHQSGGQIAGSTTITDTNWHHVVATYDGTTGIIYLDNAVYVSAALSPYTTTNAVESFGCNAGGTTNFYDGAIDEPGYWSRVLTSGEVSQLYNGGAGLQYPFLVSNSAMLSFF